jgi:hypothetical protein
MKTRGVIPVQEILATLGAPASEESCRHWFARFHEAPSWLLVAHAIRTTGVVPTALLEDAQGEAKLTTVEAMMASFELGAIFRLEPKQKKAPAARKPKARGKQKAHELKDDRFEEKVTAIVARFRKGQEHRKTTLARLFAEYPHMRDFNVALEKAKLTRLSPPEYGRLKRDYAAAEEDEDSGQGSPPDQPHQRKNWREKLDLLATQCGRDPESATDKNNMLAGLWVTASHNIGNFRVELQRAMRGTGYEFELDEIEELKRLAEQATAPSRT